MVTVISKRRREFDGGQGNLAMEKLQSVVGNVLGDFGSIYGGRTDSGSTGIESGGFGVKIRSSMKFGPLLEPRQNLGFLAGVSPAAKGLGGEEEGLICNVGKLSDPSGYLS
ncbi:hypothetical protein LINGRAHAP2_LOCUS23155 [Linum grandiflorum]